MKMSDLAGLPRHAETFEETLAKSASIIEAGKEALARSALADFKRNEIYAVALAAEAVRDSFPVSSAKAVYERDRAFQSALDSISKAPSSPFFDFNSFGPRQMPLLTVVERHTEILEDNLEVAHKHFQEAQAANRGTEDRALKAEARAEESERLRIKEREAGKIETLRIADAANRLTIVCWVMGSVLSFVLAAVGVYFSLK